MESPVVLADEGDDIIEETTATDSDNKPSEEETKDKEDTESNPDVGEAGDDTSSESSSDGEKDKDTDSVDGDSSDNSQETGANDENKENKDKEQADEDSPNSDAQNSDSDDIDKTAGDSDNTPADDESSDTKDKSEKSENENIENDDDITDGGTSSETEGEATLNDITGATVTLARADGETGTINVGDEVNIKVAVALTDANEEVASSITFATLTSSVNGVFDTSETGKTVALTNGIGTFKVKAAATGKATLGGTVADDGIAYTGEKTTTGTVAGVELTVADTNLSGTKATINTSKTVVIGTNGSATASVEATSSDANITYVEFAWKWGETAIGYTYAKKPVSGTTWTSGAIEFEAGTTVPENPKKALSVGATAYSSALGTSVVPNEAAKSGLSATDANRIKQSSKLSGSEDITIVHIINSVTFDTAPDTLWIGKEDAGAENVVATIVLNTDEDVLNANPFTFSLGTTAKGKTAISNVTVSEVSDSRGVSTDKKTYTIHARAVAGSSAEVAASRDTYLYVQAVLGKTSGNLGAVVASNNAASVAISKNPLTATGSTAAMTAEGLKDGRIAQGGEATLTAKIKPTTDGDKTENVYVTFTRGSGLSGINFGSAGSVVKATWNEDDSAYVATTTITATNGASASTAQDADNTIKVSAQAYTGAANTAGTEKGYAIETTALEPEIVEGVLTGMSIDYPANVFTTPEGGTNLQGSHVSISLTKNTNSLGENQHIWLGYTWANCGSNAKYSTVEPGASRTDDTIKTATAGTEFFVQLADTATTADLWLWGGTAADNASLTVKAYVGTETPTSASDAVLTGSKNDEYGAKTIPIVVNPVKEVAVANPKAGAVAVGVTDNAKATITVVDAEEGENDNLDVVSMDVYWELSDGGNTPAETDLTKIAKLNNANRATATTKAVLKEAAVTAKAATQDTAAVEAKDAVWEATVPITGVAAKKVIISATAIATLADGTLVNLGGYDVKANGAAYDIVAKGESHNLLSTTVVPGATTMYAENTTGTTLTITAELNAVIADDAFVKAKLDWTGTGEIDDMFEVYSDEELTTQIKAEAETEGDETLADINLTADRTADSSGKTYKRVLYLKPLIAGSGSFTSTVSQYKTNESSKVVVNNAIKSISATTDALTITANPVKEVGYVKVGKAETTATGDTDFGTLIVGADATSVSTIVVLNRALASTEDLLVEWTPSETTPENSTTAVKDMVITPVAQTVDKNDSTKYLVSATIKANTTVAKSDATLQVSATVVPKGENSTENAIGYTKSNDKKQINIVANMLTKVDSLSITTEKDGKSVDVDTIYVGGKNAKVVATISGLDATTVGTTNHVGVEFAAIGASGFESSKIQFSASEEGASKGAETYNATTKAAENKYNFVEATYNTTGANAGKWTAEIWAFAEANTVDGTNEAGETVDAPRTIVVKSANVYTATNWNKKAEIKVGQTASNYAANDISSGTDTTTTKTLSVADPITSVSYNSTEIASIVDDGVPAGDTKTLHTNIVLPNAATSAGVKSAKWSYAKVAYSFATGGKIKLKETDSKVITDSNDSAADGTGANTMTVYIPADSFTASGTVYSYSDKINLIGAVPDRAGALTATVSLVKGTLTQPTGNSPSLSEAFTSSGAKAVSDSIDCKGALTLQSIYLGTDRVDGKGAAADVYRGDKAKLIARFKATGNMVKHITASLKYSDENTSGKLIYGAKEAISELTPAINDNDSGDGTYSATFTLPEVSLDSGTNSLVITLNAYSDDAKTKAVATGIQASALTTKDITANAAMASAIITLGNSSIRVGEETTVSIAVKTNTSPANISAVDVALTDTANYKFSDSTLKGDVTETVTDPHSGLFKHVWRLCVPTDSENNTYTFPAKLTGVAATDSGSLKAKVTIYGLTSAGGVDTTDGKEFAKNVNSTAKSFKVEANTLGGLVLTESNTNGGDQVITSVDNTYLWWLDTTDNTEYSTVAATLTKSGSEAVDHVSEVWTWEPDETNGGTAKVQFAQSNSTSFSDSLTVAPTLAGSTYSSTVRIKGSGEGDGVIRVAYTAYNSANEVVGIAASETSKTIKVRQNAIYDGGLTITPTEVPYGGKAQITWVVKSPYAGTDDEVPAVIKATFADANAGTSGYTTPFKEFANSSIELAKTTYNEALEGYEFRTTVTMKDSGNFNGEYAIKATATTQNNTTANSGNVYPGMRTVVATSAPITLKQSKLLDVTGVVNDSTTTERASYTMGADSTLSVVATVNSSENLTSDTMVSFKWVGDNGVVALKSGASETTTGTYVASVATGSTTGTASATFDIRKAGSGYFAIEAYSASGTDSVTSQTKNIQVFDYLSSASIAVNATAEKKAGITPNTDLTKALNTSHEMILQATVSPTIASESYVDSIIGNVKGIKLTWKWSGASGAIVPEDGDWTTTFSTSDVKYMNGATPTAGDSTAFIADKKFVVKTAGASGVLTVSAQACSESTTYTATLGSPVEKSTSTITTVQNPLTKITLKKETNGDFVADGVKVERAFSAALELTDAADSEETISEIWVTFSSAASSTTYTTEPTLGISTNNGTGEAGTNSVTVKYNAGSTPTLTRFLTSGQVFADITEASAYKGTITVTAQAKYTDADGNPQDYGGKVSDKLSVEILKQDAISFEDAERNAITEDNTYNVVAGEQFVVTAANTGDILVKSDSAKEVNAANITFEENSNNLVMERNTNNKFATFTTSNDSSVAVKAEIKVSIADTASYYDKSETLYVTIWPTLVADDLVLTPSDTKLAAGGKIVVDLSQSKKAVMPGTNLTWTVFNYDEKTETTTNNTELTRTAVDGEAAVEISLARASTYDGKILVRVVVGDQAASSATAGSVRAELKTVTAYTPLKSINVNTYYSGNEDNRTVYLNQEKEYWGALTSTASTNNRLIQTVSNSGSAIPMKGVTYNVKSYSVAGIATVTPEKDTSGDYEDEYMGTFSVVGNKVGKTAVTIEATKNGETVETSLTIIVEEAPLTLSLNNASTGVFVGKSIELSELVKANTVTMAITAKDGTTTTLSDTQKANVKFTYSYEPAEGEDEYVSVTETGTLAGKLATGSDTVDVKVKAQYGNYSSAKAIMKVQVLEPMTAANLAITPANWTMRNSPSATAATPTLSTGLSVSDGLTYEWSVDNDNKNNITIENEKTAKPSIKIGTAYSNNSTEFPVEATITAKVTQTAGNGGQASQVIGPFTKTWTLKITKDAAVLDGVEVYEGETKKGDEPILMTTASGARTLQAIPTEYGVEGVTMTWTAYSDPAWTAGKETTKIVSFDTKNSAATIANDVAEMGVVGPGTAYVEVVAKKGTGSNATEKKSHFVVTVSEAAENPTVMVIAQDDDSATPTNLAEAGNHIDVGTTYKLGWSFDGKSTTGTVPTDYELQEIVVSNNNVYDGTGTAASNVVGKQVEIDVDKTTQVGTIKGLFANTNSGTYTVPGTPETAARTPNKVSISYSMTFKNENGEVEHTAKGTKTITVNDVALEAGGLAMSSGTAIELEPGKDTTVSAVLTPANATGVEYKWGIIETVDGTAAVESTGNNYVVIDGSNTGKSVKISTLKALPSNTTEKLVLTAYQTGTAFATKPEANISIASADIFATDVNVFVDGATAAASSTHILSNDASQASMTVSAATVPSNATNQTITWMLEDTTVAKFEGTDSNYASGSSIKIVPVNGAKGTVVLMAMTRGNGAFVTKEISIVVKDVSLTGVNIRVAKYENVSATEDEISTRSGSNTTTLKAMPSPASAKFDSVTWKVLSTSEAQTAAGVSGTDPDAITLSSAKDQATITGLTDGKAVVQATMVAKDADGGKTTKSGTFTIEVKSASIPITNLFFADDFTTTKSSTLKVKDEATGKQTLSVGYLPTGADPSTIEWASDDPTKVSVNPTTGITTTMEALDADSSVAVTATANGHTVTATVKVEAITATMITNIKVSNADTNAEYAVSTGDNGLYAIVPKGAKLKLSGEAYYNASTPASETLVNWSGTTAGGNKTYTMTGGSATITVTDKSTTTSEGTTYDGYATTMALPDASGSYVLTATSNGTNSVTTNIELVVSPVLSKDNVTINKITDVDYTGAAMEEKMSIVYRGETLKQGTDFDVAYSGSTGNTINAGTITATVKALDGSRFSISDTPGEEISTTYEIKPLTLTESMVQLSPASFTYNGGVQKPSSVKVMLGSVDVTSQFTITNNGGTDAGSYNVAVTANGSNFNSGTVNKGYRINAKSISDGDVKLAFADQTYSGSAIKPTTLKTHTFGGGTIAATNYTIGGWKKNTNAGTATATITGKGNFTGSKTVNFKINRLNIKSNKKFTVSVKANKFKKGKQTKGTVTVKFNGKKVVAKSGGYSLKWGANKTKGKKKGVVTVTGTKNFTGARKVKFDIK